MTSDTQQRQEIRSAFDDARAKVGAFTGLYADEDLANDILWICDEILARVGTSPRLDQLRQAVEACCQRLADVTNRYCRRDPTVIAAARMQVIVELDQIQDAALERLIGSTPSSSYGMLRQRSR